MTLTIINPGVQSLIQDSGRFGLARYGVPRSGAFDRGAWLRANLLVGNNVPELYERIPGPAGIEVLLGGLRVQAERELLVAVTGAAHVLTVIDRDHDDKREVPVGEPVVLTAGSRLHIRTSASGLRSYLAVAGGFNTSSTLGSRSTDTSSGIGPTALRIGQQLAVGQRENLAAPRASSAPPDLTDDVMINVRRGPHSDLLDGGLSALACADGWQVSPMSSRTGIRLTPSNLNQRIQLSAATLSSEPTLCGAVQSLPSGELVVIGPDGPTTGGYPVVAVIDQPGVDQVSQVRPGSNLRLVVTDS